MNKMKHILLLLPVAMLLAACTQDELTDNGQGTPLPEPIPLTLSASLGEAVATPATRVTTVDGLWPDPGTVYVQISETEDGLDDAAVMEYSVNRHGKLTPPSDAAPFYWTKTDQKFYVRAWYPGGREKEEWNDIPGEGKQWTSKTNQSAEADLAKDDFLYAYQTLEFSTQSHTLNFKHLMSKIIINLVNSDYQYDLEKVSVSLTSDETYRPSGWCITGDFSGSKDELNLKEVEDNNYSPSIIPFTLSEPNMGYLASYKAIVIPQVITGRDKAIEVKVDNVQYKWSMELASHEMESGYEYTFDITVKPTGLDVQVNTNIGWDTGDASGSGSVTLP